jgi:hypothetical protein
MALAHPHFLQLSAAQVRGFDLTPRGHAVPSVYDPSPCSGSGGHLGGHDHDASGNSPSLPSHRPFVQEVYTTGHPVCPGPQAVLPSRTEVSAPTPGSLTDRTPTPEPEVEPPTQALVGNLCLTYDKLLERCYYNDNWELALDPDFDPSSMVEL